MRKNGIELCFKLNRSRYGLRHSVRGKRLPSQLRQEAPPSGSASQLGEPQPRLQTDREPVARPDKPASPRPAGADDAASIAGLAGDDGADYDTPPGESAPVARALYRSLLQSARRLEKKAQEPADLGALRFRSASNVFSALVIAGNAKAEFRKHQFLREPDTVAQRLAAGFSALQRLHQLEAKGDACAEKGPEFGVRRGFRGP
eukprot:SAG22_NODE_3800_length_1526_cov_3.112824_2_plen_203_part_00